MKSIEKLKQWNDLNVFQWFRLALERFNCSNPSLEFDNVKHIENRPNPHDPVLQGGAFPSRNFELND